MEEESIKLGEMIELTGFSGIENAEKGIVRKMVGNYLNKLQNKNSEAKKLILKLKKVHETKDGGINEIKATLVVKDKEIHSESSERNLFIAIDQAMRKIESQM
ncbi:MAG TPA: hypothetical protein ENN46_01360 [Candidatus Woesearchaeota archaeon]|nr:hypothetical protein [Candidatus Woesearchaeota archaeon]